MCRMIGYLGEPRSLASLTRTPEHSLEKQSYAAREMRGAVVNADGWGAAWYLEGEPEPCLYRSMLPIWADVNHHHLGRAVRSRCLVAAVRSATDPLSVSQANTQPFSDGSLAFVHNGYIADFSRLMERELRAALSDRAYRSIRGNTDSEHVFALLLDQLAAGRGDADALPLALARTIGKLESWTEAAATRALLTLIVSDGHTLHCVRHAVDAEAPSLYARVDESAAYLASEPLSRDGEWQCIEPGELCSLRPGSLRRQRL